MTPDLSIVVPCYNSAKKLGPVLGAFRSLPENVEIIFIDDGSTDATPELLAGFPLFRQPNQGPGVALNNGIARAAGRYIWIVASDDRPLLEPVLARLPAILSENPDAAFFQLLHEGQRMGSRWSPDADMCDRFHAYSSSPSMLLNREFLNRNAIRFSDSYSCEDNFFMLQVSELQKSCLAFDDVIYEVVGAPDSIMRGPFNARYITRWRAVGDMLAFARSHPRKGLERLEKELVRFSLGATWTYYVAHGRTLELLRLLPALLAQLERWGLDGHLDAFLGSGSLPNRLCRRAALFGARLSRRRAGGHAADLGLTQ